MYVYVHRYICDKVNMALSAKDAIQKFKVELLKKMPLDDPIFFAMVEGANLFPVGTGDGIRAEKSRAHKVDYFLYHVIEPGADEYLPKLVKVMKESEVANVMRLADDIQAALLPGKYFKFEAHMCILCTCSLYMQPYVCNISSGQLCV